jgi:Ni/Fe-hydrogenase subunit HybB-like protein
MNTKEGSMSHSFHPAGKRFWTPGVLVLVVFMLAGLAAIIARLAGGLGYVTNLDHTHPWGLWISIDVVTGVALAAGGFTTSALSHIFGRRFYETITRPALLTAALGYTFVGLGLLFDIGRTWAFWKPLVYQNHTSALFEVAMCVFTYLIVLYIEFVPIVCERFKDRIPFLGSLYRQLDRILWVFIILGVVLSCMHQSSLGTLMVIAPTKVHPLWYTPILPLLFLLSAITVGYPMVVFESTLCTTSLKLKPETHVLAPLVRITTVVLGLYMVIKLGDMFVRGNTGYLFTGTAQSNAFLLEMGLGVILPFVLLLFGRVRSSPRWLFISSTLVVLGVVLNRINVFLIGYAPQTSQQPYWPAAGEFALTIGLTATLIFLYRLAVTHLPVLPSEKEATV